MTTPALVGRWLAELGCSLSGEDVRLLKGDVGSQLFGRPRGTLAGRNETERGWFEVLTTTGASEGFLVVGTEEENWTPQCEL